MSGERARYGQAVDVYSFGILVGELVSWRFAYVARARLVAQGGWGGGAGGRKLVCHYACPVCCVGLAEAGGCARTRGVDQ